MNKTLLTLVLCVLLSACTSLQRLQKIQYQPPCLGHLGYVSQHWLYKDFKPVGTPQLTKPIAVRLTSVAVNPGLYQKYQKALEKRGSLPSFSLNDTLMQQPRFFTLELVDLIQLKADLNHQDNAEVRHYLEDDGNIALLSSITFAAPLHDTALRQARHMALVQGKNQLNLRIHTSVSTQDIPMNTLEVFDFKSSSFCWEMNQRNQKVIALIRSQGLGCPRPTTNTAKKLKVEREYLKL